MSEPKIPKPTCPIINQAIQCIRDATADDATPTERDWNVSAAIDHLEEIRAANEQLRAALMYWQEKAYDRLLVIDKLEARGQ